jgi:hypothetical protein
MTNWWERDAEDQTVKPIGFGDRPDERLVRRPGMELATKSLETCG